MVRRTLTVLLDVPTPQRSPLLDTLARDADVLALYLRTGDGHRGWGSVPVGHPHVLLPSRKGAALVTCLRVLLRRRHSVFWCSGYADRVKVGSLLFARLLRMRLVMRSDSNLDDELLRSPRWRRLKRVFLRLVVGRRTEIWTIGDRNEQYWRYYGFDNCVRIPYTVPRPPPTPSVPENALIELRRRDSVVILFVGRLLEWKGVTDLLEAVHGLTADRDWRLVLVGDGPCRRVAEHAADHDPRVLVLGARPYDELGGWYDAAQVVVVPSRREPWGLVVNEARLAGAFVIASDAVGSAHDLLTTPDAGAIYPRGDVAALRRELEAAIRRPPARSRLAEVDAARLVLARLDGRADR